MIRAKKKTDKQKRTQQKKEQTQTNEQANKPTNKPSVVATRSGPLLGRGKDRVWPRQCATEARKRYYSLWGSSPRPMAHKTIALATELRERYLCTHVAQLREAFARGSQVTRPASLNLLRSENAGIGMCCNRIARDASKHVALVVK